MNKATYWCNRGFQIGAMACALLSAMPANAAFVSGSTGADGAFNPTVNTVVTLPPNGVLNYTSVNIPVGVTVYFQRNATNTPVVMLATGNVTISGVIDLNGGWGYDTGAQGSGNIGDDGLPGAAPGGGYSGGVGGRVGGFPGGAGQGPGGGGAGINAQGYGAGGGASHSTQGQCTYGTTTAITVCAPIYGSSTLLPLIGGSGGGGGLGGANFSGSGGGAGGGAILIAASGTVNLAGTISALGGAGGGISGTGAGLRGGAGSGGAVRIVATNITGAGLINAYSNSAGSPGGGTGRVRLESETYTRTGSSNPAHTFGPPGQVFIAGAPSLAITSVAGTNAPAAPTGNADITLPASTVNPVTVTFTTTGIPVGNTVKLTVTSAYGPPVTAVSPAITGTTASGSASVSVSLPSGPSTLLAQTSYTITVAMGQALSYFAQGEQVERIAVSSAPGQSVRYSLVTVSGKEFEVPLARLAGII